MLEPEGDGALSVDDAMRYAYEHGVPMITGEEISAAMDEKD
jgi:3,4-dihydroxy-2-butanone 4-phosphate synthase